MRSVIVKHQLCAPTASRASHSPLPTFRPMPSVVGEIFISAAHVAFAHMAHGLCSCAPARILGPPFVFECAFSNRWRLHHVACGRAMRSRTATTRFASATLSTLVSVLNDGFVQWAPAVRTRALFPALLSKPARETAPGRRRGSHQCFDQASPDGRWSAFYERWPTRIARACTHRRWLPAAS